MTTPKDDWQPTLDDTLEALRLTLDAADASGHVTVAYSTLEELLETTKALQSALGDMRAGWHYIRANYGDLPGVGWDRCEQSANKALRS